MIEGAQCVDCGERPPAANSEQTLISKLGWRVTPRRTETGVVMEIRCPRCWARVRASRSAPDSRGKAR